MNNWQKSGWPNVKEPLARITEPQSIMTNETDKLNRILLARQDGVEDDTIAAAWIEADHLIIESCAIKRYAVAFKNFSALAKIAPKDRAKFKLHKFGNYLHWPNYDIHLNIESIKNQISRNRK